MRSGAFEWVPESALNRAAVETVVRRVLARWAAIWFASAPDFSPLPESDDRAVGQHISADWWDARVRHEPDTCRLIGMLVVGVSADQLQSRADILWVERLGGVALDDLTLMLGGYERASAMQSCAFTAAVTLGFTAQRPDVRLHIALTRQAIIRLRRKEAAHSPNSTRAPVARFQAVVPQVIEVGALVGRCRLTLAALRGLAIGDTLVLDSSIDDPLPLTVNNREVQPRTIMFSTGDDMVTLKIARPLAGNTHRDETKEAA